MSEDGLTLLFCQDISAQDLSGLCTARDQLGSIIKHLIDVWVGQTYGRMEHPRIGTVYGYRDDRPGQCQAFHIEIHFRDPGNTRNMPEDEEEKHLRELYKKMHQKEILPGDEKKKS